MLMTEVMKDLARRNDSGIDNAVKDVETFPTGDDKTIVTHEGQMLGKVGLWKLRHFEQVFNRRFAEFQDIEDFQTLGIGQYLVDKGVFIVCLLW